MAGTTGGGESPTQALALFASELRFGDLPGPTVAKAKLSILDTIGCALFGASLPWIEMLRRFVLTEGGSQQSTLWGSSTKVSRTQAALVNATAAHSFELDDIHMGGMIHPGALAFGAAVAIGEPAGIDGRDLLASFVAGCEIGARVGMSVGIVHFRAGYHPQGTVGVFTAGATAGRARAGPRNAAGGHRAGRDPDRRAHGRPRGIDGQAPALGAGLLGGGAQRPGCVDRVHRYTKRPRSRLRWVPKHDGRRGSSS